MGSADTISLKNRRHCHLSIALWRPLSLRKCILDLNPEIVTKFLNGATSVFVFSQVIENSYNLVHLGKIRIFRCFFLFFGGVKSMIRMFPQCVRVHLCFVSMLFPNIFPSKMFFQLSNVETKSMVPMSQRCLIYRQCLLFLESISQASHTS